MGSIGSYGFTRLAISRDPLCRRKYFRGSRIRWRGREWRILDRTWNRREQEWDYLVLAV